MIAWHRLRAAAEPEICTTASPWFIGSWSTSHHLTPLCARIFLTVAPLGPRIWPTFDIGIRKSVTLPLPATHNSSGWLAHSAGCSTAGLLPRDGAGGCGIGCGARVV